MKRLLMLVTTVLLCAAGAGLASGAAVNPVPFPGDQLTAAAAVQRAMQAVLPNIQVGFEVFDRQADTVLTRQNAGQ